MHNRKIGSHSHHSKVRRLKEKDYLERLKEREEFQQLADFKELEEEFTKIIVFNIPVSLKEEEIKGKAHS